MADEALTLRAGRVPALLAAAVVVLQVGYPLVDGAARNRLTVAVVVAFAASSIAHVLVTRGPRPALAVLAVTGGGGFVVEVLGVQTGVPFGDYSYSASVGPRLFGVPPVIGLAWTMLAWPAVLAARRLVEGPLARVLVGAWALASWDLFLDPQMVAAGIWRWRHPDPHLPGVPSVPLTNYAGWMLVALFMSTALQLLLRNHRPTDDAAPIGLYLWTWIGSIVALAAFLDLGAAAAWGGLGMGLVAVPVARTLRR
jgi:uncharacterized membrane protein